jgi:phosphomannomutase
VETYRASGEINFVVSNTETAMKRVDAMYPDADKDHVDGLTIDLGNVWFNLRPSNTEPLLRLNVESADEGALESTVNELAATLEEER